MRYPPGTIFREEASPAPEPAPAPAPAPTPGGGGISNAIGNEPPTPEPTPTPTPAPAPTPGSDAAFSLYSGDAGERTLNPLVAKLFEGDDNKVVRGLLEKYKDAENPNAAFGDGMTNLKYMSTRKDVDMLADLPEDAPPGLKVEQAELRRKLNNAPVEAKGYELKRPENVPANVYWPEGIEEKHMELAHKHGVPKAYLDELMTLHGETLAGADQHVADQYSVKLGEQSEALKKEFGHNVQEAVDLADIGGLSSGAFNDAEMEVAMKAMTGAGLGLNFIKHMKWAAESISEDKRVTGSSQTNQGGLGDLEKAKDIAQNKNNPLHAIYYDTAHPRHDEVQKLVSSMNAAGLERQRKISGG